MCVIIHKPKNILFPEKDIESAEIVNPHGFGYMYFDRCTGRIKTDRSIDTTTDQIKKTFKKFKNEEVCFHFRYKTHGAIGNKQCHPFRVLDKEKHGVDMFFMHNGTVTSLKSSDLLKDESDSQAFNRLILHPLLRDNPELINNKSFQRLIRQYIGNRSKLCFMYGNGKIVKINEEAGTERAECWVSNEYSFNRNHREPRYTQSYYTNRSNSTSKSDLNKKDTDNTRTVSFFEQRVQKGSPVYVFKNDDNDFMVEGKVHIIGSDLSYISVMFPRVKGGNTQFLLFDVKTGMSKKAYDTPADTFFAFPYEDTETEKEDKEKVEKQVKEETHKVKDETNVTPFKKKEGKETEKATEKDEFYVSSSGISVDAKDRYGAGAFTGIANNDLNLEYGGVEIGTFFKMTPKERFDFFINDPESSFNMLQDVVEFLVLEDEGLHPEDGVIDFEDNKPFDV